MENISFIQGLKIPIRSKKKVILECIPKKKKIISSYLEDSKVNIFKSKEIYFRIY